MFGEFILVAGATFILAVAEKSLELMEKESSAKFLGLATKCGLGLYALRQINQLLKEATVDFL